MSATNDELYLRCVDEDGMPCQPHRAVAVEVGISGEPAQFFDIADITALKECADTVWSRISAHRPRDPADFAVWRTLVRLARQVGSGAATSPWAVTRAVPRTIAVGLVLAIESLANRFCPDFAVDGGRILLSAPIHESAGRVEVGLLSPAGRYRVIEELPSGIARWVALATDLATSEVLQHVGTYPFLSSARLEDCVENLRAEQLTDQETSDVTYATQTALTNLIENTSGITLLLADEPELHLHPSAQEEVVRWCCDTAGRWTTIVASHAPPFLRLGAREGRILRVFRHVDEGTKAIPLEGSVLEALDELSDSLGLGRRDRLLQLVRGIVFVEGLADLEVLQTLARDLIARNRLVIIPIHGHSQTRNIVQGELALALRVPVAVIFDNVTREGIQELEGDPNAKTTDEAKSAWRLLSQRERGLECTVIPFAAGDICGALPEETVRSLYPRFPSWPAIEEKHRIDPSTSFKHTFLDAIGVSRKNDFQVITDVAKAWDGHAPLPQSARDMLRDLESWASSIGL